MNSGMGCTGIGVRSLTCEGVLRAGEFGSRARMFYLGHLSLTSGTVQSHCLGSVT